MASHINYQLNPCPLSFPPPSQGEACEHCPKVRHTLLLRLPPARAPSHLQDEEPVVVQVDAQALQLVGDLQRGSQSSAALPGGLVRLPAFLSSLLPLLLLLLHTAVAALLLLLLLHNLVTPLPPPPPPPLQLFFAATEAWVWRP